MVERELVQEQKHIHATIPRIVTCNSHMTQVKTFSWMRWGNFAQSIKCQSSNDTDMNFKLEIYCPLPQYDSTQNRMQETDYGKGMFVII